MTLGLRNPVKIRLVTLAITLSLLVPYIISPLNKAKNWFYLAQLHIILYQHISLVIRIFRKKDLEDLVTMNVEWVEEKWQQQVFINLWRQPCDCWVTFIWLNNINCMAHDTLLSFLYWLLNKMSGFSFPNDNIKNLMLNFWSYLQSAAKISDVSKNNVVHNYTDKGTQQKRGVDWIQRQNLKYNRKAVTSAVKSKIFSRLVLW